MKDFLKNNFLKIILVFTIITLDLIAKEVFFGTSFSVIPGLIGVRALETLNTGGAWSIFSEHTWLLILLTIIFIVIVVILDLRFKKTHILYKISIGFVVGGAIGNLIDRLFLGGVRDFMYFEFLPSFPTFNIADSFLLIGTILFAIYAIFILNTKEKENESK